MIGVNKVVPSDYPIQAWREAGTPEELLEEFPIPKGSSILGFKSPEKTANEMIVEDNVTMQKENKKVNSETKIDEESPYKTALKQYIRTATYVYQEVSDHYEGS